MSESGCSCSKPKQNTHFVAITGAPDSGKKTVFEIAKANFCEHIPLLPNATHLAGGEALLRGRDPTEMKVQLLAAYRVQRELENTLKAQERYAVGLCDGGTLDNLAYYIGDESDFWKELGTTRQAELNRYSVVIQLKTSQKAGRRKEEDLNFEERLIRAWDGHPNRVFIESTDKFSQKVRLAISAIQKELPACCKAHEVSYAPYETKASA
jgi:hypothetical protein